MILMLTLNLRMTRKEAARPSERKAASLPRCLRSIISKGRLGTEVMWRFRIRGIMQSMRKIRILICKY